MQKKYYTKENNNVTTKAKKKWKQRKTRSDKNVENNKKKQTRTFRKGIKRPRLCTVKRVYIFGKAVPDYLCHNCSLI